jgi:hypothetical protein
VPQSRSVLPPARRHLITSYPTTTTHPILAIPPPPLSSRCCATPSSRACRITPYHTLPMASQSRLGSLVAARALWTSACGRAAQEGKAGERRQLVGTQACGAEPKTQTNPRFTKARVRACAPIRLRCCASIYEIPTVALSPSAPLEVSLCYASLHRQASQELSALTYQSTAFPVRPSFFADTPCGSTRRAQLTF